MKMNKNMTAVEILDLYQDSRIKRIFSPDFGSKDKDEQRKIIEDVSVFKEEGIDPEKIIDASRNYYYFSVDFLVNELKKLYVRILTKHDNDGGWPLVDRDYLKSMRGSSIKEIDAYLESYKDTYNKVYQTNVQDVKQVLVPTYWTNYLVLLLLNKWKLCILNNPNVSCGTSLNEIEESIKKGEGWLKDNSLSIGWSFTHKSVSHNLNTYDTSMALIAINYHMSFFSENNDTVREEFFGREHLEGLISSNIRNKDGSWKKELYAENEDIGATAYATQCLMKYYKRGKDDSFKKTIKPIIDDGIKWLVDNQFDDNGGWGEREKKPNDQAYIEKSCYALMSISRYRKMFFDFSLDNPIEKGISFLKSKASKYKDYPIGLVWPNDYNGAGNTSGRHEDSLKNSSLVISSLIRCGVHFPDLVIHKGIIGASRLYEKMYEGGTNKYWYNPIYYFCMLADCLKKFQ